MSTTTIIVGINSDIGTALAKRFQKAKHNVIGTFRSKPAQVECQQYEINLNSIDPNSKLFHDVPKWNNVIFAVGSPLPVDEYCGSQPEVWNTSFELNGPRQLDLFRQINFLRKSRASVCFLSAGGVNSCPENFSAYTLGKVFLVKAAELIAAEEPDLNIFTYGPGWLNTKTHDLMAQNLPAGDRRDKIEYFRKHNKSFEEDMDEIYRDLLLLQSNPKNRASGRNFARGDNCLNPKYQDYHQLFGSDYEVSAYNSYKLRIKK